MNTNGWHLIKEQFDALAHREGVPEDSLEQFLDYQAFRRFGELIAAVAQRKTKRYFVRVKLKTSERPMHSMRIP